MPGSDAANLTDQEMLLLLEALELRSGATESEARRIYDAAMPAGGSEPTWDEIVTRGWVRRVWGRYFAHYDLYAAARRNPDLTALAVWMGQRYDQPPRLQTPAADLPPGVATVAAQLASADRDLHHLTCVDPAWVAARLWDRNWRAAASPEAALRVWIDLWRALRLPDLTPRYAWNPEDAEAFRTAAFATLEGDHGLLAWSEVQGCYVRQAARALGRTDAEAADYFEPPPERLLPRRLWLTARRQEASAFASMEAVSDLAGLARLLWADVAVEPNAKAPHPIAERLLTLVADRPDLLAGFLFRPHSQPQLLADVALHPSTAGLACLIIAQWPRPGGAYDRSLIDQEHEAAQIEAFRDAVSVLAWMLSQGEAPATDAADLLAWLHQTAPPGFIDAASDREPLRAVLREAFFALRADTIDAMMAALAAELADGPDPAALAALLDLAEIHPIDQADRAMTVADAYTADLANARPQLRSGRIGIAGATALMTLPLADPDRARLLATVDVGGRLGAAPPGHNPYLLAGEIGAALRTHIRMLCRAAVGLGASSPPDLVAALIDAVAAAAEDKPAAGRIAAFNPSFESGSFAANQDRPIAEDLAGALHALSDGDRDLVLTALLRTDEPMVLAQVFSLAPVAARPRLEQRVEALTPAEAAEVLSLPDLQARADSLLAAGLLGPAAAYVEAERAAKPWGNVPGRRHTQFRSDLRLRFAAGDWDGILQTQLPRDLLQIEAAAAQDTLLLYRGLAIMLRGDGADPEAAEEVFADLHRRKPEVAAYALNLFAARVSRLLPKDLFARLDGAAARQARRLLADSDGLLTGRPPQPAEQALIAGHRALLHLALDEPARALAALGAASQSPADPRTIAYQAVALARLDRMGEAEAALATAQALAGPNPLFAMARAHIETGVAAELAVAVAVEVDRVSGARAALLALFQMEPQDQAVILKGPGATLEDYLTVHLREAASSLTRLAPVLRTRVFTDCEDDINTMLGELLQSRLHLQQWAILDQSRGGHSGHDNPGERDLLVRRGAIDLCYVEAQICEEPIHRETEQKKLRQHFQKLFGYGAAPLFYHITYAFGLEVAAVVSVLKAMAQSEAPAGWKLIDQVDLPSGDSRPVGFKARYADGGDSATAVFLVLDVGQKRQRAAAKQARN